MAGGVVDDDTVFGDEGLEAGIPAGGDVPDLPLLTAPVDLGEDGGPFSGQAEAGAETEPSVTPRPGDGGEAAGSGVVHAHRQTQPVDAVGHFGDVDVDGAGAGEPDRSLGGRRVG